MHVKNKKNSKKGADIQPLFFDTDAVSMDHNYYNNKHNKNAPLSLRMRPNCIEEYVGQQHILGEGKLLMRAIRSDRITSLILYGPPGTGKSSLAHCISKHTNAVFEKINAVTSSVSDIKKILSAATKRTDIEGKKTILFIDEIHRFNKAQQEVLLPDVESGNVILIGATVFNPFFYLVSPLLSRSMIFELHPLSNKDILLILKRALSDKERGLGMLNVTAEEDALLFLANSSNGDARKALNALEIGCLTAEKGSNGSVYFTIKVAQESIQKRQVIYDKDGDAHYDTASAFIKSMRGSDPDATLYWMAKMIYAGEDPRFIARRICICAAEDVGNADPQALILANAALQVSECIGMPEARIPLAQAAVYVACAPKSNAVYKGIETALKDVKNERIEDIPIYLKDASYKGSDKLGHGKGYKYTHDYNNHYVFQKYKQTATIYYEPDGQGYEKKIKTFLAQLKKT